MLKRQITIVLGIAILIGSYGLNKYLSGLKEPPKRKGLSKAIRYVQTVNVKNGPVQTIIPITGKLIARESIEVFAEVQGKLKPGKKEFKEGTRYQKGEVLLRIDDEEARLALLAQKSAFLNQLTQVLPDIKIDYPENFSKWQQYLNKFSPEKPISPLPEVKNKKLKYYLASKNILNQYYNLKSQESRLAKYVLTAPFTGVVSLSNINPGTMVRGGQQLGAFINPNDYELETAVSIRDLDFVKVNDQVSLSSNDVTGEWRGRIRRISEAIDPATQTVKVYIAIDGSLLKEGMYLTGDINGGVIENAVQIPRKLLVPPGSIYLLKDSILKLTPVILVKQTEKSLIVSGLGDGNKLLNEVVAGAYDGMVVKVKN